MRLFQGTYINCCLHVSRTKKQKKQKDPKVRHEISQKHVKNRKENDTLTTFKRKKKTYNYVYVQCICHVTLKKGKD